MSVRPGAYAPKSGPLAGLTFRSYYAYQDARAKHYGFSNYSEERLFKATPEYSELVMRNGRNNAVQLAGKAAASRPLRNAAVGKKGREKQQLFSRWLEAAQEPSREQRRIGSKMDQFLKETGQRRADFNPETDQSPTVKVVRYLPREQVIEQLQKPIFSGALDSDSNNETDSEGSLIDDLFG
jgi:hypothetical protein